MSVYILVRLVDDPSAQVYSDHMAVPRVGEIVWAKLRDDMEEAYRVRSVEHYVRDSAGEIVVLVEPLTEAA
jgi:hypothetical protein